MNPITTDNSEAIRQLLRRANLWSRKEQIVKDFSLDDRTHIAQLTNEEAVKVIAYLGEQCEKANNMRKRMLSIGYQMHFDTPNSTAQQAMEGKYINLKNVSAWCESSHCKHRKPLNRLNPFELVEVVTQFEQVLISYQKDLKKKHNAGR